MPRQDRSEESSSYEDNDIFVIAVVACGFVITWGSSAPASTFTFEKVSDFTTIVPEGRKTFTGLHDPLINGEGFVVFRGRRKSAQRGIYVAAGGTSAALVNNSKDLPNGAGLLGKVLDLSTNRDGETVFTAETIFGQHGVYLITHAKIAVVADLTTPIPGGTGKFTGFSSPLITDGGMVFFRGAGENDQRNHGLGSRCLCF